MQLRFVVGALLMLVAGAVVMVFTYFQNQELYYTVDELVGNEQLYAVAAGAPDGSSQGSAELPAGPMVQVRGDVDYASVSRPKDGLEMRFALVGKSHSLPVVYRGIVPDTFERAETVTVRGRVLPDGTFVAQDLFVQCPSKYEAALPGEEDLSASTDDVGGGAGSDG